MKGIVPFGIVLFALSLACNSGDESAITTDIVNNPNTASGNVNPKDMPVITFKDELFDFGTISQGEQVSHAFQFTNTGKSDLIITSSRGSCGCTVPDWPKKPIPPGGEGVINVKFDSDGRSGKQHKQVTIIANTQPSTSMVALKGEVIAPTEKNN